MFAGRAFSLLKALLLIGYCAFGQLGELLADKPIPEALKLNQASRYSINSLSCSVKIVDKSRQRESRFEGRYWRSGDLVRVDTSRPGVLDEVSIATREEVFIYQRLLPHADIAAVRKPRTNNELGRCDAWPLSLLFLNIPGSLEHVPPERLFELASDESISESGRLVRLKFRKSDRFDKDWACAVHFDQNANYMVDKLTYRCRFPGGTEILREYEVSGFFSSGSLCFPSRVVYKVSADGKVTNVRTIEFTDIAMNQVIPEDVFQRRFPSGIVMNDDISNTWYRIDSSGNRTSQATPRSAGLAAVVGQRGTVGPSHVPNDPAEAELITRKESRPLSSLIGPISLVMLDVLLGIVVAARLRHHLAGKS